jgi:hypothetical protein
MSAWVKRDIHRRARMYRRGRVLFELGQIALEDLLSTLERRQQLFCGTGWSIIAADLKCAFLTAFCLLRPRNAQKQVLSNSDIGNAR